MNITNINQLLPFVEKKDEFIVMDKGDYTVIDYVYQDSDTFEHPELLECRGIKFDKEGLIIARPFRKFFNYGENGAGLPMHRSHRITTKLDGSMVHGVRVGGKPYLHTRKGHTDVAKQAEGALRGKYFEFIGAMIDHNWTPIFEFTSPENRIVLRYEEVAVTLLAARHMVTGEFMDHIGLLASAASFGIPLVGGPDLNVNTDPLVDVDNFIKHTRELIGEEGYVVYFDDGYMVKVKADDYVTKHRALDDMGSKKKVLALCIEGGVDDVLPLLDPADREDLIEFNDSFQNDVNGAVQFAKSMAERWVSDRKEFAITYAKAGGWVAGVVFGIMDGKAPRPMVMRGFQQHPDELTAKWRGE